MQLRKLIRPVIILPLIPLIIIVGIFVIGAAPSGTAYACLPCDCPTNTTLNCFGPFALTNTIDEETEQCGIQVVKVNAEGAEELAILATAEELNAIPEQPEENTLVEAYYEFALYRLTTGEYQLNVGPDAEGKVYVVNWYGCPAGEITESTFVAE